MKRFLLSCALSLVASAAHAEGIPLFNVDCPGNIPVSAEEGGPVFINGKEAQTKTVNERYFEAKGSGITVAISVEDDDSVVVTYSGKQGASGICTSVDD
ncbi:hypothetical protein [Pseudomonas chlororaphis]|uniref:hypothetical protein n=1 Tax=Pseudomonas chlororaphis TaxID=587753 RepID=UPI0003D37CE5|nr:hypothetical protein [Pseudomonas chlororaphis]AZD29070.1 hypothetical protein C4K23_2321 [Pseudomonas chlororaphis]ETD37700.1 hypothetical protein U724_19580 [Pseudomonas chlororaphis subsp. aurantiaca PB-St2]QFS54589.1 hypothetical protein FD951_08490 [Pseudomonas chlororaphis subsp. aurantiaca]